ncbi:alpha/beta fold hydrolase [Myxococcota bacterium]|nr:alpha/beta fold hydrolase [Myxococcota bacterium]
MTATTEASFSSFRFSRIFRLVSIFFGSFVLLLFGVGWYFSSMLMYPGPPRCWAESFVFCQTPKERGLSYEEIAFSSADGTRLHGWWIPAPKATRAIIFSHGRGGDRRASLRLLPALHRAGFHVMALDYRNCGQNQRSFNSMGGLERQDLRAAIDFVEKTKRIHRIGLFGESLGAAISIQIMASDPRVATGIFEGGFASVKDVVAQRAHELYGLPRWPLLPIVFWLYNLRTGVDFDAINPETHIARIAPRPILLIHGDADRVVFPSHAHRLFRAARDPKTLWIVKGGKHTQTWQQQRKTFEERVVHFYQNTLPASP